jgi:hypothetical protein
MPSKLSSKSASNPSSTTLLSSAVVTVAASLSSVGATRASAAQVSRNGDLKVVAAVA